MKDKTVKILKFIVFIGLLATVLVGLSGLLEYKASVENKKPLYDIPTDVDVILAGSSHMRNGIYPVYLWKNYGITSYNIGSSGEIIEVTYYSLKEVLKHVTPKVVVVDLYQFHGGSDAFSMNTGLLHEATDFMDFGEDKIELAKGAAKANDLNILSFLSNIYAYHYRWKELSKEDFEPEYNRELGAGALGGIVYHDAPAIYTDVYDDTKLDSVGYEYLTRIIELCNEKNIACLLINVPYPKVSKERQARDNSIMRAAKEAGAYCYNMNYDIEEMGIDFSWDYCDTSGHVNIFGGEKCTLALGRYIADNFDITDYRGDSETSAIWDSFYEDYKLYEMEKAYKEEDIIKYLMCFKDVDNVDIKIIRLNDKEYDEPRLEKTMERMGLEFVNMSSEDDEQWLYNHYSEDDVEKSDIFIALTNRESGNIVDGKIFKYNDASYIEKNR